MGKMWIMYGVDTRTVHGTSVDNLLSKCAMMAY